MNFSAYDTITLMTSIVVHSIALEFLSFLY